MTMKQLEINRGLFVHQVYDSRSLTVPTTLFHRFRQEGTYDVLVHRGQLLTYRTTIRVGDQGVAQVNLDLAVLKNKRSDDPCCDDDSRVRELLVDGALCFHASEGRGGYSVRVDKGGRDGRPDTVLDTLATLLAGDVFAVTMVLPGDYAVRINGEDQELARIRVEEPDPDTFRPSEGTLVTLGRRGIEPGEVDLGFGQTFAILTEVDASIQVAPLRDD